MDLKQIAKKLNKVGYSSYLHDSINILFCCIEDNNSNPILDTTSQIRIADEKYLCSYFNRNLAIEENFNSVDELIVFIKKHFPIKK